MPRVNVIPAVEGSDAPQRPLLFHPPGQPGPVPAYLALDCRTGNLWAERDPDPSGPPPLSVLCGYVQHWPVSPYLRPAQINEALKLVASLAQDVVDGFSAHYQGRDIPARFTSWAKDCLQEMGVLLEHYDSADIEED